MVEKVVGLQGPGNTVIVTLTLEGLGECRARGPFLGWIFPTFRAVNAV